MTDLSPAAQAVLDAFNQEKGWLFPAEIVGSKVAAALRAAADHLDHPTSAHALYAFADELEQLDD